MTLNFEPDYIEPSDVETTDESRGGWERVDTSDHIMENVNDLYDPHLREITDILQWDGERNGAPIKSLVAVKKESGFWSLKRPNWFSNCLELTDDGPITAESKEGIIKKALQWQEENPVETAPDPLNPSIDD
jgi:hypothetical protein